MSIEWHTIACTEETCDPPRTVDHAPRLPIVLDGCPINDPAVIGGQIVTAAAHD